MTRLTPIVLALLLFTNCSAKKTVTTHPRDILSSINVPLKMELTCNPCMAPLGKYGIIHVKVWVAKNPANRRLRVEWNPDSENGSGGAEEFQLEGEDESILPYDKYIRVTAGNYIFKATVYLDNNTEKINRQEINMR